MYNAKFIVLLICHVFKYFSFRDKVMSDRIDTLVLRIEQLEMERDKFEK